MRLHLGGAASDPESLGLSDLCSVLESLSKILHHHGDVESPKGSEPVVSLRTIERTESTDIELSLSEPGIEVFSDLTAKLTDLDGPKDRFSRDVLNELRDLDKKLASRGLEAHVRENNDLKIHGASLALPFELKTIRGTTTLYGLCVRAGGERKKSAQLRLLGEASLRTVQLASTDLATRLGKRLYDKVGLSGDAEWNAYSWELESFKATKLLPFRDVGVAAAVESVKDVAAGTLDELDALDYVRSLRGT